MKILWADDDSEQALKPLGWFIDKLLKEKVPSIGEIKRTTNYRQASDELSKAYQAKDPYHALLLDVVLPHVDTDSSLSRYHGLRLAEIAVELEVKSIIFLTVVPQDQIKNSYQELIGRFGDKVCFKYHSKLDLAAPGELDKVVDDLINGKPTLNADNQGVQA
ncbi:MAG: hypothetical protein IPM66_03045 [Acidobacteriota bacterium]|nr:MAG: hypothetical protein IPM66_03045 [Acidobacteriota bacterium]